MKLPSWVLPGSAVLFCVACAVLQSPAEHTRTLAAEAGFMPLEVPDARLRAYARRVAPGAVNARMTVYIESDGAPWRLADEPPADPTPLKPVVMRMAIADPSAATAYLGRPCQYLGKADLLNCDPRLWMQARFSNEAVAAMSAAVDQIKRNYGATEINLVGYSGGGAMAALIAARRSDVSCLVTIAAPLDTDAWTAAVGVSRLDMSLNPADSADRLRSVRQTHFRGLRDKVVPPSTASRFLQRVTGARVVDQEKFDHLCCWGDEWKELRNSSCLAQK
ncbi:MAG: alpha/beta hydrolase [Betaproteobacteria bacterium]|nr:alpha/beta hydrolase [Betaproteobacteria bacterium]